MTAPTQDLRKPARWFQNSVSETRVLSPRPERSPSCSESGIASEAFLPLPPHPHPGSHPRLPRSWDVPSPPGSRPPRRLLGSARTSQAGCMRRGRGHAPPLSGRPCSPPRWAGEGQEWWPPWHPKEGQTEGNKPTGESHPGWRRGRRLPRGRAGQGNGVHRVNASGLETGSGGGARGSEEGRGQSGGRRKSSHAARDKSFVALSDSQSIDWCLLEPGTQGSVEEESARRGQEGGLASCPGLHFAVIICTNSS